MLTFDALSPRFALLGLGPSWMLMDGVFCQLATFDRTQPEGLALATYLGAVSALANTVVVPAHAAAQRKLRWPTRRWVAWASYAQLASCALLAACWSLAAGGASLALYAAVFVASLAGNGQQLALNPWAAELGQSRRIVEMMAGGDAGALVAALLASAQRALPRGSALAAPSPFFAALGVLLVLACAALRALEPDAALRGGGDAPAAATNPLRDDADDDDVEILGDAEEGDDKDDDDTEPVVRDDKEPVADDWEATRTLSLAMPPLGDGPGEHRLRRVLTLARSNAAYQLTSWVLLRSLLPYAINAAAPAHSSDGAVFLAFAINGSLVACFLGACLAARDRAPLDVGRANAVMVFAFAVVAVVATACAFGGRPRSAAPCVAIALAAAVIRGLDGYCTPLFYREIHAVSGSVAVLQWSGILAIWVVNAGVWVTLVAVALGG